MEKIQIKKYIFTFNYAINYGAFLQCFALNSLGKDYVVADLTPRSFKNIRYCVGPYGRKKLPGIWIFLALYRFFKSYFVYRYYRFKECDMLVLSQNERDWNNPKVKQYLDNNVAIIGSDQIWNPKMIEGMENVYFAGIADFSKRIAYAASIGMAEWPDSFKNKIIDRLRKFNAISVREQSAVKYLNSIGIENVAWVCDPTLLNNGDFYKKQFGVKCDCADKYVFHYVIREKIPASFFNFTEGRVISINAGNRKNFVSVSDWLSCINNSEYVVTDSFHCVVFCLLFHKKFIVVLNKSRGSGMNERFFSLLGKTNLMYRCVDVKDALDQVKNKLFTEIDWNDIDLILDNWRHESIDWLNKALET